MNSFLLKLLSLSKTRIVGIVHIDKYVLFRAILSKSIVGGEYVVASRDLVSSQANDTSLLDRDARRTVIPVSFIIRSKREPAFPMSTITSKTGACLLSQL